MFPLLVPLELPELPEPSPIVNGAEERDEDAVVLLVVANADASASGVCTGSHIAPTWVLTAAHCVTSDASISVEQVDVGWVDQASDLNSFNTREAAAWYPHPDYNEETGEYDVALVELADSRDGPFMRLSEEGPRVRDQGEDVVLMGFGAVSDADANFDPTRRRASVPLVDFSEVLLLTFDAVDEQNGCYGDSGGPLLRYDDDGGLLQAGVMDFVSGNCDTGGLGAARLDAVVDFIAGYTTEPEWVAGNWGVAPEEDEAEKEDDGGTSGLLPGREEEAGCSTSSKAASALPGMAGVALLALLARRRRAQSA